MKIIIPMSWSKLFLISFLSITFCFFTQAQDLSYPEQNFDKYEYKIPMRDGIQLHTTVYVPKDQLQDYPILMKRTP